jgi:hypothetical protein
MSISQNEGLQAAVKAVAAVEPRQNQDKSQIEEKQYDKPDAKDVNTSNSKAYVVSLTDEAVKRSGDAQESYTGERDGGHRLESESLESGKLKVESESATDKAVARAESGEPARETGAVPEEVKSAQVEEVEVKNAFVEPERVEVEVQSATNDAAKRAASGEVAERPGALPGEVQSTQVEKPEVKSNFVEPGTVEHEVKSATDEAVEKAASGGKEDETAAGGLKDPGTTELKSGGTEAHATAGGTDKAKESEQLTRPGTIDQPAEKRVTEKIDKQDQAEELRKSISVYA